MKKLITLLMVLLFIVGCSGKNTESSSVPSNTSVEPKQEKTEEKEEETVLELSIRPEVKEAIDAYESFIDKYCEFMEKYAKSGGSDFSLIADYLKFMQQLSEYGEKMDNLEDDLTDAEFLYYLEVYNRCNEKIIKSTLSMDE